MDKRLRTDSADAQRELANMTDSVQLASALAGIAEVEVWRLETLAAAGIRTDEEERSEASAQLTRSLCSYGVQVKRMVDFGSSLADIAHQTGLEVDELRQVLRYAS